MSVIEDLKQGVAQDIDAANARLAAIEAIDFTKEQLSSQGFHPELSIEDVLGREHLVLRVDLNAQILRGGGSDAGSGGTHRAREPRGAAGTEGAKPRSRAARARTGQATESACAKAARARRG